MVARRKDHSATWRARTCSINQHSHLDHAPLENQYFMKSQSEEPDLWISTT